MTPSPSRVGTTRTLKPVRSADPQTGREIWRVSPEGVPSTATYMYVAQFTPDERYLFYQSRLDGALQLHRYELDTGALTQVTDLPDCELMCYHVHPAGREVFYKAGGRIWASDVETLQARCVYDPARRPEFGKTTQLIKFSRSGRWLSFGYLLPDGRKAIGRMTADGDTLESLHVFPDGEGPQHLMFCNSPDEDLLSFSPSPDHQQEWTAPPERRARTYLLNARTRAVEPLFVLPEPFTATHDFWSPAGERLYYHKKTRPTWTPTWINSVDRATRRHREIYRDDVHKLGHCYCTRDEKWLVSDVQEPGRNPLILIETATGRAEILCWPNSSVTAGHGAFAHTHPSWSPCERFILYTSDASGCGQVYLIPMSL